MYYYCLEVIKYFCLNLWNNIKYSKFKLLINEKLMNC